jgi:group I intron endonuclease
MSGIYKIINNLNNKIYIGSAINFTARKNHHLSCLKRNKHGNKYLQKSFNKYGEQNFIFELIEECNKEDLLIREQYYLDTFKPQYNMCKIAGSNFGIKRSKETCEKLKISNTGKKQSIDTRIKQSKIRLNKNNKNSMIIKQYDIHNNLITTHYTSTLASEKSGVKRSNIANCLCGINKTAGGFIWKYEGETINE